MDVNWYGIISTVIWIIVGCCAFKLILWGIQRNSKGTMLADNAGLRTSDNGSNDKPKQESSIADFSTEGFARAGKTAPKLPELKPVQNQGIIVLEPSQDTPVTSQEPRRATAGADDVSPFPSWWGDFIDSTHVFISGGKGSGKSTLVRARMKARYERGSIFLVVDPHHQKGSYGDTRPYAGGRNFLEAAQVFRWILGEIDRRYKERDEIGTDTDGFQKIDVIIDEADTFTNIKIVPKFLCDLAIQTISVGGDEARKVNIDFTFIFHGTEVDNVGLAGRGSKRDNFALVQLRQGENGLPEKTGLLKIGSRTRRIDTVPILEQVGFWVPDESMMVVLPVADEEPEEEGPQVAATDVAMMMRIVQFASESPTPSRREVARRLFTEASGSLNYKGDGPYFDKTVKLIVKVEQMLGFDPIPPKVVNAQLTERMKKGGTL